MKPALLLGLTLLALPLAAELRTDYKQGRSLLIEIESEFSMETTDFSMEVDGEPVDARFGGGAMTESRTLVVQDTVLESAEGKPLRLRREFKTLESEGVMTRGDEDMETEREAPLEGVTLELTLEDEAVQVEVVDGDSPDDEALLEGHSLALALDALLPEETPEAGEAWELDGEQLARALSLDVERALFPAPERPEGGPGRRRGEERLQGRGRGGRGGRRGANLGAYFQEGIWDASATLLEETEEVDGVACRVIQIEGECMGSLPERERGEGGGRRGGDRAPVLAATALPATEFEVELEGKLLFDTESGRPVHLEVEGTIQVESTRERSRGETTMTMYSAQEGGFTFTADLSEVADDEE